MRITGICFCVLLGAWPVFAQNDATIIGQVKDPGGLVLPGVTVVATSPALQLPSVSAVTNENGEYRLASLPIGTYEITYRLSGFEMARREAIRLTIGFTARVDLAMKIGAMEETVTVSGASPVVDATSTTTNTQLTRETLELVPSTRNGLLSLMQQSPGVRGNLDVGGSNFTAFPVFQAYGQNNEQWTTLEGVLTNSQAGATAGGNYWDYTTFEETNIGALGKNANVPLRGVSLAAIVKSGGNAFHGEGFFSGSTGGLQSGNIDAALAAKGINSGNALQQQYDFSAELGGRLIKDKLWFYGSGRRREVQQNILGVTQATPQDPTNTTPAPLEQSQSFETGKLSYQASRANRFVGFFTHTLKHELPGAAYAPGVSPLSPWETRDTSQLPMIVWKTEWQAVKGNFVASAQTGYWMYDGDYTALTATPSTIDIATLVRGGANTDGNTTQVRTYRNHATGTLSWYTPDGFLGKHQVTAGVDYMIDHGYTGQAARPASMGDYLLQFSSGTPVFLATWNNPSQADNIEHYASAYVSDHWTPARRVTLNLGLRYARDNAFVPAQCSDAGVFSIATCIDKRQFNVWNSISPRLYMAIDLAGNGKSVLKGGWGRFDHKYVLGEVGLANPLSRVTTTYRWHDLNGDKLYQPGEVDLSLGGGDYVSQSGAAGVADPNEPQPKQDQFYVGLEHELLPNVGVRATGVYSRYFNVPVVDGLLRPFSAYSIPITKPDPGPDGVVGTADDPGTTLTYYDYPAAFKGPQFDPYNQTSLPTTPTQSFKTIEVAVTRRQVHRWSLNGSFSATKKNIPFGEGSANTPNAQINTSDQNWEWLARAAGSLQLPWGVLASANYDSRSGATQARTVLLTGGVQIPNAVVNATPLGAIQLPATRTLDVRLQKTLSFAGRQKITARINVYNLLNANTIQSWQNRSGAAYLNPLTILPPRIMEFGASYSF